MIRLVAVYITSRSPVGPTQVNHVYTLTDGKTTRATAIQYGFRIDHPLGYKYVLNQLADLVASSTRRMWELVTSEQTAMWFEMEDGVGPGEAGFTEKWKLYAEM